MGRCVERPKLSQLAAYLRDRLAPLVPPRLRARQGWLLPALAGILVTLTVMVAVPGIWGPDSKPPPEAAVAPSIFPVIVQADPPEASDLPT